MKFNNETIRTAVKKWLDDAKKAEETYGHISEWEVSDVTNMNDLFLDAKSFNQDISKWDVSNVISMRSMFTSVCSFKQDIGNWNVCRVENMQGMFSASSFNQDISSWDVSNVTNMYAMFSGNKSFNQDISKWDVSNVTDMTNMFAWAKSFNQDIGNWDVSSVNDMSMMFYNVQANTRIESDLRPLYYFNDNFDSELWKDKSKAKEILKNAMREIEIASNLHRDDIYNHYNKLKILLKDWDQNQHLLDYNKIPKFNLNFNIGSWDVSNVTDMSFMFAKTYKLNIDIEKWNVCKVTSMYEMFYYSDFNKDISNWDVSNVTDMRGMFQACPFNHDIGNWDVSNVTDMKKMFYQAHYFNKDISNWDVSNVTDMEDMFYNASKFNQNLKKWKVGDDTEVSGMFYDTDSFNQETSDWKWFEKTVESSGCINVDIEGYSYTHGDGESEFGAYELSISFGGSWADGDGEYEILNKIRKELNCDHIIITNVKNDNGEYEYYRIVDLPEIFEAEFVNSHITIESNFTEDEDVINFVKNFKTISYKKLNPNNDDEIDLTYL